ncbi:TadE/TadG family type IV pilus assembly protein [Pigmentiphaga litoralis]|uniref:Flp pilus assembly protein TadG n=1 Tax=Pigmentiphaga litoralis TaxID=516702 RepID=A0A7Y9IUT7_9BURK|nr:TadE/TadG family type IV pilus assembly protein [Pigmentiphaga litoralis]NYE22948.1 Flp pilus assembly protein TadG [Pigmentiphaga litoralis]NYE83437.1 Flp pilus assembly protein TadG [Pigmentiphaga litoralis]
MAIIEFLLVALPLFLLGVGVIEVTRWAVARQAISYALFEAARTGAITGGDSLAIQLAFERA